jgi:RHS repeat-associated protein
VGGTASIQYDSAGHITSDGTNTFTHSDRGRMVAASNAGGTVTYAFNGFGQRASKSGPTALVPAGTNYYLYDEAGQLLGEYDATGAPVYETIYLGSAPVGALKQTGMAGAGNIAVTIYNVYADQIDTPRMITQQDHTIVWRWDTAEAFGATAPDQNPSSIGTFAYNQRFPGQVFDSETGLFQNWNREYNARLGRYVQSDPIGLNGGINTFAYAGGNPIVFADPTGTSATLGARVGFVGGGAIAGPPGAVVGAAVGAVAGYIVGREAVNWMESRSQGSGAEARPPDVNPGKDCDGKCNPCPANPPPFRHEGDAHGSTGGFHVHQWQYHQAPDCTCRAQKVVVK